MIFWRRLVSLDLTKRGYIPCCVFQHCVSLVYWLSIYLPWGCQITGRFSLYYTITWQTAKKLSTPRCSDVLLICRIQGHKTTRIVENSGSGILLCGCSSHKKINIKDESKQGSVFTPEYSPFCTLPLLGHLQA